MTRFLLPNPILGRSLLTNGVHPVNPSTPSKNLIISWQAGTIPIQEIQFDWKNGKVVTKNTNSSSWALGVVVSQTTNSLSWKQGSVPTQSMNSLSWKAYKTVSQTLTLDWRMQSRTGEAGTYSAAYGLRLLRSSYSGSLVRVRRSSDNAEQDIGYLPTGLLDTSALTTFVGSNSAFVVTWYDQSGNTRNLTQSTSSLQPILVNAGTLVTLNGHPAMTFDGTDDYLLNTSPWAFTDGAQTANIVGNWTQKIDQAILAHGNSASANAAYVILKAYNASTDSKNPSAFVRNDSNVTQLASSTQGTINAFNSTDKYLTTTDSGSNITIHVDGAESYNNNYTRTGVYTLNRFALGALVRNTVINNMNGKVGELIMYNAALNSTNRGIVETNQKNYFGL